MRKIQKVALLIETSRGFGRDVLCGISRYVRIHGPWSIHIQPGDFVQELPKMKQWGGTGIIARISNDRIAKAIIEADVPTISLGPPHKLKKYPSVFDRVSEVSSDPVHVTTLAADHLLERQLRNFAYVGMDDRPPSILREQPFQSRLADAGHGLHVYRQPSRRLDCVWEKEQIFLAEWLRSLPKPVGLFACNDDRGRQVLEACQLASIRVPEEVAVLGVDNDEVFCELSDPPLSSVILNAETAGYRAAELLDGLMSGRIRKRQRILVEALGVFTRRSTDVVAVEDPDVAAALQFIRHEKGRDISVTTVANSVAVSRRNLEKRFRAAIGRTILEEIQLVRLDCAKRLLLESTYPISRVAEMSGFGSTGYFIQFFLRRVGETPRRFRAKCIK
jgi:LacI family transcriptional regulator, galactose operon repressor